MIVKDEDMPKCKFCGGDYTQGGSVTSNAEAYWCKDCKATTGIKSLGDARGAWYRQEIKRA